MKQYVMTCHNQIFDGGEWHNLGIFPHQVLTSNPQPRIEGEEVSTFSDLLEKAQSWVGLYESKTFISKRPMVKAYLGMGEEIRYTERNFSRHAPIELRQVWEEFNPTMEWLMENLSADDFAQYAKDRDWYNTIMVGK